MEQGLAISLTDGSGGLQAQPLGDQLERPDMLPEEMLEGKAEGQAEPETEIEDAGAQLLINPAPDSLPVLRRRRGALVDHRPLHAGVAPCGVKLEGLSRLSMMPSFTSCDEGLT